MTTGKSAYGILNYNQLKVNKGKASVLSTRLIFEDPDGKYNVSKMAEEFHNSMPECIRTEKPIVHISLNPDPKDEIDDELLITMAEEYLNGMGWGKQPHIIYKHTDNKRVHIHIVTTQVDITGRKINDSHRNRRSVAMTEELEKKYHLHPAKERKQETLWQLKPIDYHRGDLKNQIAAVVKPLLALYRIGVEELQGSRAGRPYHGLVYTVLDENGEKAPVTPLKASSLGDDASLKKVETILASSPEKIKSANLHKMILHHVEEALIAAPSEEELCKRLKTHHIDLFLRRNDQNRITGVTFIDHENRCVLNGYRLGKRYSANAFNERFGNTMKKETSTKKILTRKL
ncbi:hypothetical protein B5G09_02315 [Alistipes sp. An54]|nr:hypothetical protein B5G09_02315 [Alistipes sp. An54]